MSASVRRRVAGGSLVTLIVIIAGCRPGFDDASSARVTDSPVSADVVPGASVATAARDAADPALAASDSVGGPVPDAHLTWRLFWRIADVPLSADPSCNGVGARSDDRTVGDYLSGFLAAFADRSGRQWIRAQSTADTVAGQWRHELLLQRTAGEEQWAWGVRFTSRRGAVDRASVRCVGG